MIHNTGINHKIVLHYLIVFVLFTDRGGRGGGGGGANLSESGTDPHSTAAAGSAATTAGPAAAAAGSTATATAPAAATTAGAWTGAYLPEPAAAREVEPELHRGVMELL